MLQAAAVALIVALVALALADWTAAAAMFFLVGAVLVIAFLTTTIMRRM